MRSLSPALLCSAMAFQIYPSMSNFICNSFKHIHRLSISCPKTFISAPAPKISSLTQLHNSPNSNDKDALLQSILSSKRKLSLSIISLVLNGFVPNSLFAQELKLERYTDAEGFTLLKPSSYVKVDKAGATVLFEEANKGSNNVGVVVNPVRLTSLGEFGSPEFVADKVIQAERRKESTKDAKVVGIAERSGQGGLQVYEFEYEVDSTRGGMKRIFSAAFVASKKLYLLNIVHSEKPESPLDNYTRTILEKVLHSFDAAPMT